jgi:hypothetical protein
LKGLTLTILLFWPGKKEFPSMRQEALLTLVHDLQVNSIAPMFLVLGAEFYQLKTGDFNALRIIAADVN